MATTAIWISWVKHLRNQTMAKRLGVPLFEYKPKSSRLVRYLKSIAWTCMVLARERPRVVICMNPSIVLALFMVCVRRLFGISLVIDAHFIGVEPAHGQVYIQRVLDWLNKNANLVIVTNEQHAERIRNIDGQAFVCPDPLPDLPPSEPIRDIDFSKAAFLICSFDADEPFEEVFTAFEHELKNEGFKLYVSGNYHRAGIDPGRFSAVVLLGFVDAERYHSFLRQSAVILDLTRADNCLVCGAYEALAEHKVLVLSNSKASMDYFGNAALYTENSSRLIADTVRLAFANQPQQTEAAKAWVLENSRVMNVVLQELKQKIDVLLAR